MWMQAKQKRTKGFTLVELLISCMIIGVLVSIAIPSYVTYQLRAHEQKALTTLHAFANAQKEYWFDQNPNTYAVSIGDLTPTYVDLPLDDGHWQYTSSGDDTTFVVTAQHLDSGGAPDDKELEMDQTGSITRRGSWPY